MQTTRIWPPVWCRAVAVRSADCWLLDFGAPAPIAYFRMLNAIKP